MNLQEFTDLYQRIEIDPSILLLGQNYRIASGSTDPIWQRMAGSSRAKAEFLDNVTNYPALWKSLTTQEDRKKFADDIQSVPHSELGTPGAEAVMRLRWSLIYTSAIDGTDVSGLQNVSPIDYHVTSPQPKYMNKGHRWLVNLCGSPSSLPPLLSDSLAWRRFEQKIASRIGWIEESFLSSHGVLVIDGLVPSADWLNDETLFGHLFGMAPQTIYWFSAPSELGKNASILEQNGILKTDARSFLENLNDHMPEISAEFQSNNDLSYNDPAIYTSLTLKGKESRMVTEYIRRADIQNIGAANICVLDDDALCRSVPTSKPIPKLFAEFLNQGGIPKWHLFQKRNNISFYLPRGSIDRSYLPRGSIDRRLRQAIDSALKGTKIAHHPIILTGPSNSGKSTTLARIALDIAQDRMYPVIYIRGDLSDNSLEELKKFITFWFCNPDRFGENPPQKTLVVWDGIGLKHTDKDYYHAQKILARCNAIVVGSAYESSSENVVHLPAKLSQDEENRFYALLSSVSTEYEECVKEMNTKQSGFFKDKSVNLLYVLQAIFRNNYDPECIAIKHRLDAQYHNETLYAEYNLADSNQRTWETRIADGMGATIQEAVKVLRQINADRRHQESIGTAKALDPQIELELKKLPFYERLDRHLVMLNRWMAVASEFGIKLPFHLLMLGVDDDQDGAFVKYSEDRIEMVRLLQNDTLIEFTQESSPNFGDVDYAKFRHPFEAETYICLRHDVESGKHTSVRKTAEVGILLEILDRAGNGNATEADIVSIIELIRQFGPNGHKMLSELLQNPREQVSRNEEGPDYREYSVYWPVIAESLHHSFPDDIEATITYAHLTREALARNEKDPDYSKMTDKAINALQDAGYPIHISQTLILSFDERNERARNALEAIRNSFANSSDKKISKQYQRLIVELCANYQQEQRKNFSISRHNQIRSLLRNLRSDYIMNGKGSFLTNRPLDILLNSHIEFKHHINDQALYAQDTAEILSDIDEMLDLDDLVGNDRDYPILKKVLDVYREAENGSARMNQLQEQLERKHSDLFLYVKARLLWTRSAIDKETPVSASRILNAIANDRYLIVARDLPFNQITVPDELVQQAMDDARHVVEYLEANKDYINKTNSTRCVAMLLRAKWLLKTGNSMLAERQMPGWTSEEWNDLIKWSAKYKNYCDRTTTEDQNISFAPAYFLLGVDSWVRGDMRDASRNFRAAKNCLPPNEHCADRLILCKYGTKDPRQFKVSIQLDNESIWRDKYKAKILDELTEQRVQSSLVGRYNIYISDSTVRHLCGGRMPRETKELAKDFATVQFNMIGAEICETPKAERAHEK